jgi:hypothetical protein
MTKTTTMADKSMKPTTWTNLNVKPPLMFCNGVSAPLLPGDDGFACAIFEGYGVVSSEVPNLLLTKAKAATVMKKPAGGQPKKRKPAKKKPAKKEKPAKKGGGRFAIMFYKNSKSIGIREKFGDKKQVISFGGVACTKPEEDLRELAQRTIEQMEKGTSYVDAKVWAKGKLAL